MKFIKKLFKYGVLVGYILLIVVLIVEASLPGKISAGQSNAVGDIITDITGNEFEKEPVYINPTSIDISIPEKDRYLVGETYHLNSVILPSDSSNKSIIWESSDPKIAKISSDGTLRLLAKGNVLVTGTIKDTNLKDSIEINVEEILLEDFNISCDKVMDTNHQYTVHVDFIPSNATNRNLTWKSSDPNIATINSSGHVVPKSQGIVTFSATSSNGVTKSVSVEIKLIIIQKVDVTNLVFNDSIITLTEGDTKKLDITVLPVNATTKTLKYESSDKEVVSVDNKGNITCLKNGYSILTVTSLSNPEITITIGIVVNSKIAEFNLKNELNDGVLLLHPHESIKLEIDKISMPVEYEFIFSSDNINVCEVSSDGVINGIDKGTSLIKILCVSGDGVTKQIEFKVEVKKEVDYTAITNFYYMIRKGIGHFGAFFVLALLASLVVIMFFKKKWLYSIISLVTGFLIAGLTEFIQVYVPGRSGLFKDVMIDYTGYIVGSIITLGIYFIIYIINRRIYGKKES